MSRHPDEAPDPAPVGDAGAAAAPQPAPGPSASAGLGHKLHDLERKAATEAEAGERAASALGQATEAMRLEAVATGLHGDRVLVGHVLGTHLALPAGGIHGPRQTPAVVYLFADAVAVRPSDDAPMSTVPIFGLHMLFPPLAVTRWLYKGGRIEHANLDLVHVTREFEAAIADWTVDDFAEADPKLQVHGVDSLTGPVHVYERIGFAHLWFPVPGGHPLRLKSTLPATADAFATLWQLCGAVHWAEGIAMDPPSDEPAAPEA